MVLIGDGVPRVEMAGAGASAEMGYGCGDTDGTYGWWLRMRVVDCE